MQGVTEIEDSYRFTQGAFYLMGIMIFLPHQFLSTCTDYWMYKFRNPVPPPPRPTPHRHPLFPTHQPNHTDFDPNRYDTPPKRNIFQSQITASFNISNAASMTISLLLLILFREKLPSPHKRIKASLITTFVLFLTNTFFTLANTDGDKHWLFIVSIVLSGLLNHCSALTVMSFYEIITKFPIKYYVAISSGSAVNGSMSALIALISLSFRLSPPVAGTIHFSVGCIIMLLTMVAYWYLQKNSKYFIYKVGHQDGLPSDKLPNDQKDRKTRTRSLVWSVLGKMKWYYASLVVLNGSTALVFPGYLALVVSTKSSYERHMSKIYPDIFFTPLITFFGYNFTNFLGREFARVIRIPKNWSYVFLSSVLRFTFVILFAFCNSMPRKHTPVLFNDDAYIAFIVIFGFSEGLLINLSFLAVPTVADDEELEIAVALVPLFIFASEFVCGALSIMMISFV